MYSIPNEIYAEINSYSDLKTSLAFLMIDKNDSKHRLRQLWRHQNGLGPLLELLPSTMWTQSQDRGPIWHECQQCRKFKNKYFNANGVVPDDDTVHLLVSLGGQMMNLIIPSDLRCPIISDIATPALAYMKEHLPQPLLRVASIECWEDNDDWMCGPCTARQDEILFKNVLGICHLAELERIDIPSVHPNTNDWLAESLGMTGSFLREMRLSDTPDITRLWENRGAWTNLTRLFINNESVDMLRLCQRVASLQSLEHFNLEVSECYQPTATGTTDWCLPRLKILSFRTEGYALKTFLRFVKTPILKEIYYHASVSVDASLMHAMFCSSSVLKEISIAKVEESDTFIIDDTDWGMGETLCDRHVEPLLELYTLQRLRLDPVFESVVSLTMIRKLRKRNRSELLDFESLVGWEREDEDEDGSDEDESESEGGEEDQVGEGRNDDDDLGWRTEYEDEDEGSGNDEEVDEVSERENEDVEDE